MGHQGLLAARALLFLTVFAGPVGAADEEGEVEGKAEGEIGGEVEGIDRTPIDCIQTNRIRRSKVVDDKTIVFELKSGDYLVNLLERECPGLGREKRFMHETHGRLCDIDTVTVIEQWGTSLTRGFTCMLGAFHPITEIEAELLIAGPDAVERAPVEVKEVDLPPGETEPAPATETDEAQ
jgi:hypothetical protein